MKLRINSGILDVDVVDGLSYIRDQLKKISQEDSEATKNGIKKAGLPEVSPHSSKSNQIDKLNAKPRMPI